MSVQGRNSGFSITIAGVILRLIPAPAEMLSAAQALTTLLVSSNIIFQSSHRPLQSLCRASISLRTVVLVISVVYIPCRLGDVKLAKSSCLL